ncbi:MAG TPA: adenylyl-sulfate kinase, partial [Pusillimonas sp.]|nr:adenylyl-sulfate kinase [Pusillimonas sp.]
VAPRTHQQFVLPVQWVTRPDSSFRGFSGTVVAGHIEPGETVRVTASGQTANVKRVVTMDGDLGSAQAGDAITLTLDAE